MGPPYMVLSSGLPNEHFSGLTLSTYIVLEGPEADHTSRFAAVSRL